MVVGSGPVVVVATSVVVVATSVVVAAVVVVPTSVVVVESTVDSDVDGAEIGSLPSSAHAAADSPSATTTAAPRRVTPLMIHAPGRVRVSDVARRDSITGDAAAPGTSDPAAERHATATCPATHDGVVTLDDLDWPIRTERLLLRRATVGDGEEIWAIRSRPGVSDWLTRAAVEHDEFVAHAVEPDRLAKTLIVELLDPPGTVVGDLMISIQDPWAQHEVADQAKGVEAELGWVLSPDHSGRGYATEAVLAAMSICFDRLGLRRVVANCFADNEASWRLMERIGMRREVHTRRESLHRSGEWLDGLGYALLADEWQQR